MIKISPISVSELEAHWGSESIGGKIPNSTWMGQGARNLGHSGGVRRFDLLVAFEGFTPNRRARLFPEVGEKPAADGWLIQAQAHESLRNLWTMAPMKVRIELERIHHDGFAHSLTCLEQSFQGPHEAKQATGLPGACFAILHNDPFRADVPILSSTAFLANAGIPAEGPALRWTLTPTELERTTDLLSDRYREAVGEKLHGTYGLETHTTPERDLQIVGVPQGVKYTPEVFGRPWSIMERLFFSPETLKLSNWRNQAASQGWREGEASALLEFSGKRKAAWSTASDAETASTSSNRKRKKKAEKADFDAPWESKWKEAEENSRRRRQSM
jgi:hypothetical protein